MEQHQPTISETLAGIAHGVKRLGALYFEKARLKTTEKITILLATVAFSAVMMALGVVFFIFVSIGVGHYLATTMAPHMAYIIIAAFYLLLLLLAMAMRRRLFVDPIARFMSRLLVEEPEEVRAQRLMNEQKHDCKEPDGKHDGHRDGHRADKPVDDAKVGAEAERVADSEFNDAEDQQLEVEFDVIPDDTKGGKQ